MMQKKKKAFITSSKNDFEELIKQAKSSERKRYLLRLHPNHEAELHSMINVFCKGSYVQPHRHKVTNADGQQTTKGESFVALQGKGRVIQFNDEGEIIDVADLDAEQQSMLWIPHDCWHTVLALSSIFIVFENKTGPWDAATDKAFHTYFPNEEEKNTEKFLQTWESL
jgi:cupin fold WbuC family metalloprotein